MTRVRTENRVLTTEITLLPFPGVPALADQLKSPSPPGSLPRLPVALNSYSISTRHTTPYVSILRQCCRSLLSADSKLSILPGLHPLPPHTAFEDQMRPLSCLRASACAVTPTRILSWGSRPTHCFQEASPTPAVPAPRPPAPPSVRTCPAHPRTLLLGGRKSLAQLAPPCVLAPHSCAPNG